MKILYFGSLKESIGKGEDTIKIDGKKKIYQIIDELKNSDSNYNTAFRKIKNLQYAVNCEYVNKDCSVTNNDELAIFPPVTGG